MDQSGSNPIVLLKSVLIELVTTHGKCHQHEDGCL